VPPPFPRSQAGNRPEPFNRERKSQCGSIERSFWRKSRVPDNAPESSLEYRSREAGRHRYVRHDGRRHPHLPPLIATTTSAIADDISAAVTRAGRRFEHPEIIWIEDEFGWRSPEFRNWAARHQVSLVCRSMFRKTILLRPILNFAKFQRLPGLQLQMVRILRPDVSF
jgi:hypothetical protein